MIIESFFNYKRFRWMWVNLTSTLLLILFYFLSRPIEGAHGSTFYGYTVGILAALGIVYLMWYGVRKRSYKSHRTTLKGWLSAHVWLGIALLIAVPLHSGFEFALNVHTLAYALMVVTILSGIWGAVAYQTLAPQIESHRGGGNLKTLVEQFHLTTQTLDQISAGKSDAFMAARNASEVELKPSFRSLIFKRISEGPDSAELGTLLRNISPAEQTDALNLIKICEKKRDLAKHIQREVRLTAKLRLWLLTHLPLSFALLVALVIHIVVVLIYR